MVNRQGFWIACESLVGPAAVELQWRQLAGEEYGKQLEKLTKTQARVIEVLYEAAQQDRPEMLYAAAIATRLTAGKMSNVFRNPELRAEDDSRGPRSL